MEGGREGGTEGGKEEGGREGGTEGGKEEGGREGGGRELEGGKEEGGREGGGREGGRREGVGGRELEGEGCEHYTAHHLHIIYCTDPTPSPTSNPHNTPAYRGLFTGFSKPVIEVTQQSNSLLDIFCISRQFFLLVGLHFSLEVGDGLFKLDTSLFKHVLRYLSPCGQLLLAHIKYGLHSARPSQGLAVEPNVLL